MKCDNCGREFERTSLNDWTPCCDTFCNGAATLRACGWTITQAFQCASPEVVVRMVRNVFDAHEFMCGLKMLAIETVERLSAKLDEAKKPSNISVTGPGAGAVDD